jgi:hypothetical protein
MTRCQVLYGIARALTYQGSELILEDPLGRRHRTTLTVLYDDPARCIDSI